MFYARIAIFSLIGFILSVTLVYAGDVLFEAVMPWYYWWSETNWGSGGLTYVSYVAIAYTPMADQEVCTINPGLYKSGNPMDSVILTVKNEGTVVGTATVPATQVANPPILPQQAVYTSFTFSPCLKLSSGIRYFFLISRTQLGSDGSYQSQISNLISYPQTTFWTYVPVQGFTEKNGYEPALRLEGPSKTPVLIIPGIGGSELNNDEDLIWADLSQMFSDIGDDFLTDNLMLYDNGESVEEIEAENVIQVIFNVPFLNINIFKDLFDDLVENGYPQDLDLFLFPYDWRLNLDNTKDLLKDKIEEIKSQTGAPKINIIAHSMGGLLVKDYINFYGKNSIEKLIFVGTPHLGAPKAGKVLLEGDNLSIPWLEEERIKEVAKNSPALHQLLPNPNYFTNFQGYIYQSNSSGSLDYQETKQFLINQNSSEIIMDLTENFWSKELENLDLSGIDVYNFAGCNNGTQAGYRLKPDSSIGNIGYASGDKTVPFVSSDHINTSDENKFYLKGATHIEMPSQEDVRRAILDILSDEPITLSGDLKSDSSECNFKGKSLAWHSPVAVHVYDSEGRHTGPIENEGIENNIPGVDYEIIGHDKFVFLPTNNGEIYNVVAEGLATGSFDLLISQNNNGITENTNVFNDVPIGESGDVNFDISNSSPDNSINLDYYGNNIVQNVQVSSVLSGEDSSDLVAPETEAVVNGQSGNEGWYLGNVSISLLAVDDSSGVLETKYSFDGQPFAVYSESINVSEEGLHTILYYSVDKAGNNEEVKTLSFGIDMTSLEFSAVFDIETESFKFSPVSDEDNINFSCDLTSCLAVDTAGNTTQLEFSLTREGRNQILNFKNINYNGINYNVSGKKLIIKLWEQKDVFRDFDQGFWVNDERELDINYKEKQDQSLIFHKLPDDKPSRETVGGKRFLQILTNKGKIEYIIL